MIPSPQDLQYFLTIADSLNLSRAAEKLGVGQPTLTQALKRLEYSLGEPLFLRQRIGVKLTRAGRVFQENARKLLQNWDEVAKLSRAAEKEVGGRFSIGCHPAVGRYALPRFMRELLSAHERLDIRLVHGLSRMMLEKVVSSEVDFAIVINPVRHPDLVMIRLSEDRVGFWQSARALPDVLIMEPELHQTQALLAKLERRKVRFRRMIPSSDLSLVASLADAGLGLAILPERVAAQFPALRPAGGDYPWFRDELFLVYRAEAQRSASSRAIIDAIKQGYAGK